MCSLEKLTQNVGALMVCLYTFRVPSHPVQRKSIVLYVWLTLAVHAGEMHEQNLPFKLV